MNYRHAFHAGNFADLLKHAVLLDLLATMTASPEPLTVIDSHAGAGLYDLAGDLARRTGEGDAGAGRLMTATDAPPALRRLAKAVAAANGKGAAPRYYPGSPLLVAGALRPRDSLIAFEARDDDYSALKQALPRGAGALALKADGWNGAAERAPAAPARLLALVDPPFEAPDDHAQIVRLAGRILRRNPRAVVAIWLPLKDLATYDAFLGDLADGVQPAPVLVVEVRLRPPLDPMKMNGCAMAVVNAPPGLQASGEAAAGWIAANLGEADAAARAWLEPSAT